MRMWSNERGACSICMASILTLIMVIAMGGTLHYSLKGQEQYRATQLSAQTLEAGEREAVAVSRIFAAVGGGLVQTDLFRIQEMLQKGFVQEGLVEAAVIDSDNMIVAAKDPSHIGQQVRDINWMSMRAQNREVVSRTMEQANRLLVTVVEPMKENDETVAWAKLTYALTQPAMSLRTPAERLKQTSLLTLPLALLLLLSTFVVVRWVEQQRFNEEDDSALALEEEPKTPAGRRLKKAS